MMEDEFYNTYSFLLNRTARRVKQFAQRRFKEMAFGITVDQWTVLKALYGQEGGATHAELARLAFKDTPTLTRMLALLEAKGLVARSADEADRRRSLVCLTPMGVAKVEELRPKVASIRQKAWLHLNQQDFEHFKRVLDAIYKNLES
jgi:DNA-binding MarR family transcriptional regulator